jgi:hypothetical protein
MTSTKIKVGTFQGNYPVSALKFSEVNRDIVKNHSKNFIKKISAYGWIVPIVIDQNGNIIEGHHRVKASIDMGLKSVPAYIIDWVNTSDLKEYQDYIMNLNASNRSWYAIDYLKTTSINQEDYKYVYQKYEESKDILSVGNVLNIYFNSGCNQNFKDGKSRIKNLELAEHLFNTFYKLKAQYGKVKFQAFTINRTTKFMYSKCENISEVDYIFSQLEFLAKTNNAILSSVEMIKPFLKEQLDLKRG